MVAFGRLLVLLPLAYPSSKKGAEFLRRSDIDDTESGSWHYDSVDSWRNIAPLCHIGRRQSPIQLRTGSSIVTSMPPIKFGNYDIPLQGPLIEKNNGHTIEIDIPAARGGRRPFITGAKMNDRFEAINVHFHWGAPGGQPGSEHIINGTRYDAEMHIVHKNARYETIEEALGHSDGFAVLGIMLEITENPGRYPALSRLFNRVPALRNYHAESTIRAQISLRQLLGDINTKNFFTYRGSVTTPPCSEAVSWIVFPEPLRINYDLMARFWGTQDNRGLSLNRNYRPLQSRDGRIVYYRSSRRHS